MCIPLIALIIAATFFLGWGMKNQQHVKVANRYKAWREVRWRELGWQWSDRVSGSALNDNFFYRRASTVDVQSRHWLATETVSELVDAAADVSVSAGQFAEQTAQDRWPRNNWARVSAMFPIDIRAFEAVNGPIAYHHSRSGVEWRRGEAGNSTVIRARYLDALDETLGNIPAPAQNLSNMVRNLYRNGW